MSIGVGVGVSPTFIEARLNLKAMSRPTIGWYTPESIEAAGAVVTGWADLSGAGNHFNDTGVTEPALIADGAISSKSCIQFDGVDDYLRFQNNDLTHPMRVFLYCNPCYDNDYLGGTSQVLDGRAGNSFRLYASSNQQMNFTVNASPALNYGGGSYPISCSSWQTITAHGTGDATAEMQLAREGVLTGNASTPVSPLGFTLGALGSLANFTACRVAEMIVFDTSAGDLSDPEIEAVQNYLREKYAPSLPPVRNGLRLHFGGDNLIQSDRWLDSTKREVLVKNVNSPFRVGDNFFRFDSSVDRAWECTRLKGSDVTGPWTMVARVNPSAATDDAIFGTPSATPRFYIQNGRVSYDTFATLTFTGLTVDHVLTVGHDGNDLFVRQNGVEVARTPQAIVTPNVQSMRIGQTSTTGYDGDMRALSFYLRNLSDAELSSVEQDFASL